MADGYSTDDRAEIEEEEMDGAHGEEDDATGVYPRSPPHPPPFDVGADRLFDSSAEDGDTDDRDTEDGEEAEEDHSDSDEEEGEEGEEDVEEFIVSRFLDTRLDPVTRERQVLVSWEGYPSSANSWEPWQNVQHCQDEWAAFLAASDDDDEGEGDDDDHESPKRHPRSPRTQAPPGFRV